MYISTWAGAQAQISNEGGNAGLRGREQGAGGAAGGHAYRVVLMAQAPAVGGGSQGQAKPSRRESRVGMTCLVDGDRQTKNLK